MTRMTIDINDDLLEKARLLLGTKSKVDTINRALAEVVRINNLADMIHTLDTVEMDYSGSHKAWRFGGGRDLSPEALIEKARHGL